MRYIANVISKSKKYKFNDFINVTNSYEDIDVSVPTLVVGTEIVKSIFGENISYVDRKIDENTYWTFSVTEKRTANEDDIEKFKKLVIKKLRKKISYKYIDIGQYDLMDIDEFADAFLKNKDSFYLFTDKMLYISNTDISLLLFFCILSFNILTSLIRQFNRFTFLL